MFNMRATCSVQILANYTKLQAWPRRYCSFQTPLVLRGQSRRAVVAILFFRLCHIRTSAIDAVLRRRLFISPEADRFELIHRTVAEFLAGK